MQTIPLLKLDWCSFEAAKYACVNWHYSKTIPAGKRVMIGVWENSCFIGSIIFSTGAAPQSHCPYKLKRTEVCELTRIALTKHITPVTRLVKIAFKLLKKLCPNIKLIISYADPEQGHTGQIYKAGNWINEGKTGLCEHFQTESGKRIHSKTLKTGKKGYATKLLREGKVKSIKTWKYKYIYWLNKREPISTDSSFPVEKGGANPTLTLQKSL